MNTTQHTQETYDQRNERERRERTEISQTAAAAVSAALTTATGDRWTGTPSPESYCPHYSLTRQLDGLTVEASLSRHKRPAAWHVYASALQITTGEKLSLHDHRRRDEDGGANIGAAKSAEQIARDIVRRILPLAEELATRAVEARRLQIERQTWLDETTARVIDATRDRLKLEAPNRQQDGTRRELRHWGKPHVVVTLDAYDCEVKVEADDLSPDTALAMLAQLPAVPVAVTEEEAAEVEP